LSPKDLDSNSIEINLRKRSTIEIQYPMGSNLVNLNLSSESNNNQIHFIHSKRNEKFCHLLMLNQCNYGTVHPIFSDQINSHEILLLLYHLKVDNSFRIAIQNFEIEFDIYLKKIQTYTQQHITVKFLKFHKFLRIFRISL
jgi:hypothetical protein